MLWIQEKYISFLSSRLNRFKRRNNLFNFRCPYCHDSQKSKTKARGYLYIEGANYLYHCQNCKKTRWFKKFLYEQDTELYKQYQYEVMKEGGFKKKREYTPPPLLVPVAYTPEVFKGVQKVVTLSPVHPVRKMLRERLIPDHLLTSLYYTPDFESFVNSLIPEKFEEGCPKSERLIIPLLSPSGDVFGFQGRTLKDSRVKYLTILLNEDNPKVYGLDTVNFAEKFYVTEGPIDSMFLPNAIAACGSDVFVALEKVYSSTLNAVLVFDNEKRNKQICDGIKRALQRGFKVVIWPDSLPHKDINKMVQSGMSVDQIVKLIDENTFQGMSGMLRLGKWRRC
jgi:hypothetical protein